MGRRIREEPSRRIETAGREIIEELIFPNGDVLKIISPAARITRGRMFMDHLQFELTHKGEKILEVEGYITTRNDGKKQFLWERDWTKEDYKGVEHVVEDLLRVRKVGLFKFREKGKAPHIPKNPELRRRIEKYFSRRR